MDGIKLEGAELAQVRNAVFLHEPVDGKCPVCSIAVTDEGCYTWRIVAPLLKLQPVGFKITKE
jgi:hypothetical protein